MPLRPVVEWRSFRWIGYALFALPAFLFFLFLKFRTRPHPARPGRPFLVTVGSISAGGSGKTPTTEWLARQFAQRLYKVAILTHGYRKQKPGVVDVTAGPLPDVRECGDEARMLGEQVRGLPIIVIASEDRQAGLAYLRARDLDMVFLDSGLQDRSIRAHFDIAVADVEESRYPQWALPVGRLRDRPERAAMCDVQVITKCEDAQDDRIAMSWVPLSFRSVTTDEEVPLETIRNRDVLAVAGLGHSRPFERMLRQLASTYAPTSLSFRFFRDHYWYRPSDIRRLSQDISPGGLILTTHKDAVKLRPMIGYYLHFEIREESGRLIDAIESKFALLSKSL